MLWFKCIWLFMHNMVNAYNSLKILLFIIGGVRTSENRNMIAIIKWYQIQKKPKHKAFSMQQTIYYTNFRYPVCTLIHRSYFFIEGFLRVIEQRNTSNTYWSDTDYGINVLYKRGQTICNMYCLSYLLLCNP